MDRLEERVAIVTGSTRGIGAAIAERFAAEGASVVVSGRSEEEGKQVAERLDSEGGEGEATFVRVDMRDPDAISRLIEKTVEEYGRVDVLVNNAGVQTETTAREAGMDDWEFVLETNFRAYWLAVKEAIEHIPEGGSIINVSSNHARTTMPAHFPYNAMKAGINGMTRALAVEFGPLGVRANTISPGWIEVERTREELLADRREYVESIHPLGKIGDPEDVAGVAAFLTSDDAAFMTGSNLLVDGGRGAVMEDEPFLEYRSKFD
ncbi:MAG: SDR family oxidoreductase [Euryarchaeota archaeon]|nr:SDR family oxidoreductase [Euryarchaeota archaeon]